MNVKSTKAFVMNILLLSFITIPSCTDQDNLTKIFDNYFNTIDEFSGNVLVAISGEVLFQKSYGYANLELEVKNNLNTRFRIGSITKQFTSMAIMILMEQGKLKFTDPIATHIKNTPESWNEITIHHLLTHTSGIIHSWELDSFKDNSLLIHSLDEIINLFKNVPLVANPGEKFHYSGAGYFLLAKIIEITSGMTYEEFLEKKIFDKIGMQDTGMDDPTRIIKNRAVGYMKDSLGINNALDIYMPSLMGGGNMYSTINDLLKWDQAIQNNKLISESSKKIMFTSELKNYAYGWRVIKNANTYITKHNGRINGFFAKIHRYPNEKLLIVLLTNCEELEIPKISNDFVKLVRSHMINLNINQPIQERPKQKPRGIKNK